MFRIQIEVMFTALVVVLGLALAGTWYESLREWAQTADFAQAGYVACCVFASTVLAGVAAKLQYALPDGVEAARRKSMAKALLRPTIAASVTACIVTMWATFQMATIPATSEFQLSVLQVTRWLDIGILILCAASAISIVVEYRRASAQGQVA